MTLGELVQLSAGFAGALCFGILFNLRGKRLVFSALGGLLSWALFLFLTRIIKSETINYFIVAAAVSVYSEIMARLIKTPAAPIATTSLIPLIPGSSFYYTMAYAFASDSERFLEKAVSTLKLASALALGIIVVTAVSRMLSRRIKIRRNI